MEALARSGREPRYVADPAADRRLVELDGLTILFHRPSGLTHVLASPAPELLDLLAEKPLGPAGIAAALGVDDQADAAALIAERLAELEEAGLVRRA